MSRWFRFYDDAINDPKVQRLSADMFRAWVNMLCLASKCGGSIPKADIAFALRASEKGAQAIIDCLIERNLLDDMGDVVTPHNWEGRQYKSDDSKERVKRHRERKSNGQCNVTDTVTVTPPEQNRADTEQIRSEQIHAEFLEIAKTDFDDPNLYGSLYGIQQLLASGYARETILSGAASAMRGKEKAPNWAYFVKVIASENERRAAPAKPERDAFVPSVQIVPDEKAIEFFKKVGRWHRDYGPEPGMPGCRASPEILEKYGYRKDAA